MTTVIFWSDFDTIINENGIIPEEVQGTREWVEFNRNVELLKKPILLFQLKESHKNLKSVNC